MSDAQAQREDRWRGICRDFRYSGMTRKAFCEFREIALSTFGYWLKQLSVPVARRQSPAFVPMGTVELNPRAVLRLRFGGEVAERLCRGEPLDLLARAQPVARLEHPPLRRYTVSVHHPATDHGIDLERAAARILAEDAEHERLRAERYEQAQRELERALDVIHGFPEVRRVRVWGSLLRPDRFTELSDIDICIEGVSSPEVWSRLERALLHAVTLPLDLVRWETLMEPHRESITARGKVVYESD